MTCLGEKLTGIRIRDRHKILKAGRKILPFVFTFKFLCAIIANKGGVKMIEVKYGNPKKLGGRQSIFVTFPYSQDIVSVIRCVPERFWDSKNLVWELDYKAYDFLREHLPKEEFKVIGEPIDTSSLVKKDLKQFSLPESLQTNLFDYQREDFNTLMNFNKRLVLHDTGLGKAQPLYSKVLTHNGFVNMGDVKVGMKVMGEDGKPYEVLGVYPQGKKKIYSLHFSDGSSCECCGSHLWTLHYVGCKEFTASVDELIGYYGSYKAEWSSWWFSEEYPLYLPDSVYKHTAHLVYIQCEDREEECQCIYVSNPTHLYITDDYIPTHNTVICSSVAQKRKELGLADHTLILCLNTLTVNWYREIKKHFNEEATILGAKKDKRGNLIVKSNADKLEDLRYPKTYFLITNIESLQNKEIVQELVNLCKKKNIMIIEDEIHKGVSNPGTKQGKAFLRLKPKYSLGLSGTLLTNSALNLYAPLKFVDGFQSNYTAFKSHFVIYGGYGGYQVVGYKNLAELQVLVDTYSIKRKKEEVLDLPDINFKNEYLQMGKAQSKIYAEVLEQTLADVDKIMASINPLSMLMRLRQCTATTEIVSSTVNESIKFDRMTEILEDVVNKGEKLIIFSNWTQVLDFAKLRIKYGYAMVTGEVKDKQAQLDKFTNNDNCKVLLATIGAAGTGLTLTVANTLLFLDSPWNYATFVQVSSRIHRIGQTKNCDIISLLAANTIDERIMDIVEKKKKLGEAVVDGKYNLKDRKVLEWLLE